MPIWIETEDKVCLLNADRLGRIEISHTAGEPHFAISADEHLLIDGLTASQAEQAMKHLTIWLPATTPRTIRMSELALSVKGRREARHD